MSQKLKIIAKILGLIGFVFAIILIIALLSYHPDDNSFNTASNLPIHNLMGKFGAYFADIAIAWLGAISFLIPLIIACWAWRISIYFDKKNQISHWRVNLILLPCVLILSAILIEFLSLPNIWIFNGNWGGVIGNMAAKQIVKSMPANYLFYSLITLAIINLILFLLCLGLSVRQWLVLGSNIKNIFAAAARSCWWLFTHKAVPAKTMIDGQDVLARKVKLNKPASNIDDKTGGRAWESSGKNINIHGRAAIINLVNDSKYQLPPIELLEPPKQSTLYRPSEAELQAEATRLEAVLDDFGIKGQISKINFGPVVTLYELVPAPGTKTSRVIGLSDDIARSMSAVSTRVSVVPGQNVIGIEIPNPKREMIYLSELLASREYNETSATLSLVLGKNIAGNLVLVDLARMPHLLVAGTTGSGKSVAINTMILSLLYRLTPDACRLILIDPKMLELSVYEGVPHLLAPVVTDANKAVVALKWAAREMEERYRKMSQLGVRNLSSYNAKILEAKKNNEILKRTVQTGFDPITTAPIYEDQDLPLEQLPLIVIVVDEFADLMLIAGKEIEIAIQRLAQMARAAGLHLILATQRPSVDVITGTIKANFPTRVSFQVTSKIDSRTILGEQGAEQLLGQGDMLYMAGGSRITRVHGPFCSDLEVERVVSFLKKQGTPDYLDEITEEVEGGNNYSPLINNSASDDLYRQAVELVLREQKASASFVQRHLQIGYNRAAKIIEQMEAEGIISKANHVGKRNILSGDN